MHSVAGLQGLACLLVIATWHLAGAGNTWMKTITNVGDFINTSPGRSSARMLARDSSGNLFTAGYTYASSSVTAGGTVTTAVSYFTMTITKFNSTGEPAAVYADKVCFELLTSLDCT
jgi:hypothetical protein